MMSMNNLNVYSALKAYSKQVSLSRLVQGKNFVGPQTNVGDEGRSEDVEPRANDIDQEIMATEED